MILKRFFIVLWILVGSSLSGLFFITFSDDLFFLTQVLLFFNFSLFVQYRIQRNFFRENTSVNSGNEFLLKSLKKELIFSCLIGIAQGSGFLILGYFNLSTSSDFKEFQLYALLVGFLQPFISSFLYLLLYLVQQNSFLSKEVDSFKKLSKITQTKTLQDLVSPHFLFNSLNTVASITSENPRVAIEFVDKLSDLYDFILKNNENQLIELGEELEIVEKYEFLIQTRFGDFFFIDIKIPKKYFKTLIPPLTLQNLVENAVKHNSVTRKKPLTIKIEVLEDFIIIQNNINPKQTLRSESTKLGLHYIKRQFQEFSSSGIKIIQNKEEFRVEIPLIYESKN